MGKAAKWRDCPAVGRRIRPIECGQNRGTNYTCPPECPYCPWTQQNYDDGLEIERDLERKIMAFYAETVGHAVASDRLGLYNADGSREAEERISDACYQEFYSRELEPGKRLLDIWCEQGWPGLTHDELLFATFSKGLRPALIECVRVVDDLQTICIDRLQPELGEFLVCDRGLAAVAIERQSLISWIVKFPFFHLMHGIALPLPMSPNDPLETLAAHVSGLGGPSQVEELSDWMRGGFNALRRKITDEAVANVRHSFRNMDARHCVATYRITSSTEVLGKLLSQRDDMEVEEQPRKDLEESNVDAGFIWLRRGMSKKFERQLPEALQSPETDDDDISVGIWGHIRLQDDTLVLEAFGEQKFRVMQEMMATGFGDHVEFTKEAVTDITKQMWGEDEDGPLVRDEAPAKPDIDPEILNEVVVKFFKKHYEEFLVDQIPALDGMTPREAAADPAMRERLVNLMKGHIQSVDEQSRAKGVRIDIHWVLRELGLDDLISEPSPLRPQPAPRKLDTAPSWWQKLDDNRVLWLRHLQQLPPDWLEKNAPELHDYLNEINESLLTDDELAILMECAGLAIRACVPRDIPVPALSMTNVDGWFQVFYSTLEKLVIERDENVLEALEIFLEASVQPALLTFIADLYTSVCKQQTKLRAKSGRKKGGEVCNLKYETIILILLYIEAVLRAIRESGNANR